MKWFHDLFIEEARPALERHSGGGEPINNQDKTITQNGTYIADEGFTGLGTVSVNVAREDQTDAVAQLDGLIDRSITEVSSNVTSIGEYAFYSFRQLTTASFPLATSIGLNAFYECSNLTTASVPLATSIDGNAFYDCSKLTIASFPLATSIGNSAFYGCSKIAAADFPLITSIVRSTFGGCSNLATASFPMATSIGSTAFQKCSKLTTLILRSETMCTLSNTNAFTSTPIASGTGYIYVPSALVDSYKAATNWSTYASQFRALEDYTVDGTITGALDSTKI